MIANPSETLTAIDGIVDNFSLLEEWDDRYRYVIELGRNLGALPDQDRTDAGLDQTKMAAICPTPMRQSKCAQTALIGRIKHALAAIA